MKKAIYLLFILISIFIFTGCNNDTKKYSSDGLSITMKKGLVKKYNANGLYYEDNDIFFIANFDDFEDLIEADINSDSTIEEYTKLIFENQGSSYNIITKDNFTYFTYEYTNNEGSEDSITYYYVTSVHKSSKGFWITTFGCQKANQLIYADKFIEWSKTIEVK